MTRLQVSVVLTVLNEAGSLPVLLRALSQQTRPPDEIVVVDGGSHDDTLRLLNEFAARHQQTQIIVKPGVNIAQGRNLAIAEAHGPVIAVTDGGCRPHENWLDALMVPLEAHSSFQAVAGRIVPEPQSRFEYFSGLLCLPTDSGNSETRSFFGRSSAFRKSAWERAGGYPEWLYTAEDTLFALRFNQLGFEVAYADNSMLYWRPRNSLYKLAKMFFLYGVGQGRIDCGTVEASVYWLRIHGIWITGLILGAFFSSAFALTIFGILYLYYILARPVLAEVRQKTDDKWAELYVPIIVLVRSFSSNLGFLWGHSEYRHVPHFRRMLVDYLA